MAAAGAIARSAAAAWAGPAVAGGARRFARAAPDQLAGSKLTRTVTAPGTTSMTPGSAAALMAAARRAAGFPSWAAGRACGPVSSNTAASPAALTLITQ